MCETVLLADLLAHETRVWQALVAGDPAADAALLAAGFTGLYPDGFAGRADHAGQLAQGPTVATFTLTQARVLELAPDVALLAYHARYTRPKGGAAEQMWVSSIWQRAGAGWINIFSQDTPCDAPFIPV